MSILLSADIGGTKTILQLSKYEADVLTCIKQKTYQSADWQSFEALLDSFTEDSPSIDSACLAIAGPISLSETDTFVDVTNLPWKLSRNALKDKYQIAHISLINDFQAIAHSVEQLSENDLITFQEGKPSPTGTRAFIGAGTGLGQAISFFNGLDYDVISTEGGHCDFAANNDFEVVLYQFLNQKYTHVSYERLLSGEGLYNIYQFFLQICSSNAAIIEENKIIESHADKAKAISQQATAAPDGLAARSLALFFRIYGAQAGNLALTCLPAGGIYIAGGIAGKNINHMKTSDFLSCFNAKGRMQKLMEDIPVKVITTEISGLLGATNVALKLIQKQMQKH